MNWNLTENQTLLLILTQSFGSQFFLFLQKWHHAYLQRAYTKAEVSLHIGYYLGFQPHLAQERTIPHPTQNIMTLTLTFAPDKSKHTRLGNFTLCNLHHCISSVLCCNQNTHFMQGPKNDYTHAYNHPLSNLLSFQCLSGACQFFVY